MKFSFFLLVCLFITYNHGYTERNKACADFNYGASAAALAGLYNVYVCPQDGVSQLVCNESFPLKSVSSMTQSSIGFDDIIIYMLIGPNSKTDAFLWWLQFVTVPMDLVFVADYCVEGDSCTDTVRQLQDRLNASHPQLRTHIVRALPSDSGYNILSCKLRTGMQKIYQKFPTRKYYLKIDTDTILFPRRLFSFLNTLESVKSSETQPLYFGTVVESGSSLLLCGRLWKENGDISKGGICYAQGGAGYGLNNVAMEKLSYTSACDLRDPDKNPEDTFTAIRVYDEFKVNVIHCGGFRSSELVTEELFKHSISFHYIDYNWLQIHGNRLTHHYSQPSDT